MYELIADWQSIILFCLASALIALVFIKIEQSRRYYREAVTDQYLCLKKEYNRLVSEEGVVYDTQLKTNEGLDEISSLYEITKDMSKKVRFIDIFKITAEYLQKNFLFRKARLIVMRYDKDSSGNIVHETTGISDSRSNAPGIFPKLEISNRGLDDFDKRTYNLLKNDIKQIQITRTAWEQSPYAEYLPENAQTFMAVPIVFENQLIGILAVEDLPVRDLDKFSILASQFSLEMRRIILYERVEEMAITDGLTKAFVRRHIMERLSEEFERSIRHNFALSFLMIDIDHFKNYNDTYGHLVGDVVLKEIVSLLKANTREVDLVGRYGGEEFCVILPETGKDEARLVAGRIKDVVAKHEFKAYDETTSVTVSIGIAVYSEDSKNMDGLIDNSDKALYAAKNSGRNRVCLYNAKLG